MKNKGPWTVEEVIRMCGLIAVECMTHQEVADELNRTVNAIGFRASKMKLAGLWPSYVRAYVKWVEAAQGGQKRSVDG